jgi:hypothetical protein
MVQLEQRNLVAITALFALTATALENQLISPPGMDNLSGRQYLPRENHDSFCKKTRYPS